MSQPKTSKKENRFSVFCACESELVYRVGYHVVDLSFVDNFVKCSIGLWADTLAALLPSEEIIISYFIVNKR